MHLLPSEMLTRKLKDGLIGWSNLLVKNDWVNFDRELIIEEIKMHLGIENAYKELRDLVQSKNR